MNDEGTDTVTNQNSWNNKANIIFVDQPAGTGFSYGKDMDSTEEQVGEDFYNFLNLFFDKFPQLRTKDFYITGESYGGHYVPAIAHRIWLENKKITAKMDSTDKITEEKDSTDRLTDKKSKLINLKGIGIGNGLIDASIQYPYYPEMAISTNHHAAAVNSFVYYLMKGAIKPCVELISLCERDVVGSCLASVEICNSGFMLPYSASGVNPYDMRLECKVPPLCNDYSNLKNFLNQPKVKKELGIPDSKQWDTCNTEVNLQFVMAGDGIKSMKSLVVDLMKDIKVLVYAGDQDYICNWLGNQAWVNDIDSELAQQKLLPWKVNGKTSGEIKTHENLTFLRVYEAGHMVPQDQPEAGLSLLNDVLIGTNTLVSSNLKENQKFRVSE